MNATLSATTTLMKMLILCMFLAADATTAQIDDHRVLWSVRLDGYSLGRRVDVGPDGTLYTSNLERLYAYSPSGQELWTVEGAGGGRPVTFGADGTIYTGGSLVTAINPDGTVKWQYGNPRPGLDLAAGPNIGPNGNIYGAMDVDGDANALGVFSLDPDGNLRWSTGLDYPMISLRGPSYTDIVFDTDRMYITVYRRLSRPPTIRCYDYDGDLLWYTGDMPLAVGGPPQLHSNGSLIVNWAQIGMQALSRDADLLWIQEHPMDGQLLLSPDIGADGTIYSADWSGPDWWTFDSSGSTIWLGPQPGYDMIMGFAVTPNQEQLIAAGSETFGVPGWIRGYDATGTGEFLWQIDLPSENGLNQQAGSIGTFSADSRTSYIMTSFPGDADYGYLMAIDISLDLDCDSDGVLDINDNCVCTFNPDQVDIDGDGIGEVCDPFIMPDNCIDALDICAGTIQGNSIGATNDGLSSCNVNAALNKDVWYKYTPRTSGITTIDGNNSPFAFYLSVHTGCPGSIANQITCDFDSGDLSLWPMVTFDAIAGETYYIRVNGFSAVEMWSYTLTLTGPDCSAQPPAAQNGDLNTRIETSVDIILDAVDDGLPNGTMSYSIGSLPIHGELVDTASGLVISDLHYVIQGEMITYTPSAGYLGLDSFTFYADDGGVYPDGGTSNIATVKINVDGQHVIYDFLIDDTDPGFATTGEWAFGQPTGGGSHNLDPTSGFTGNNVYGYNLTGDYPINMSQVFHLTTIPLDFSDATGVNLRFQRWLAIENSMFDHAALQISSDGITWTTVWDHIGDNISPTSWEQVEYDISAYADGQSAVQVRWAMGATDFSVTYPGWNIDDIEFSGVVPDLCLADTNHDGVLTPSDFTSWIAAFNSRAPGCDQNGDGSCTPADFTSWIANFNAGC